MTRALLIELGWDAEKLYNIGGSWEYKGEHKFEIISYPEDANEEPINENSFVLRMADTDVKSRTLIVGEYEGYHIEVRRVKRTNELVIDGKVYDEYEACKDENCGRKRLRSKLCKTRQ